MPKSGLKPSEWRKHLQDYVEGTLYSPLGVVYKNGLSSAEGTYTFGSGQKPPKGSTWATEVAKIDHCPQKNNHSGVDLFGRKVNCTCVYHKTHLRVSK